MIFPSKYVGQFYHVARTLGEVVNGKLDTRLSTLCTSSKINQFSKWKPIDYNGFSIDEDILKSKNYGITITSASTVDNLKELIDQNGTHKYNRPLGGINSPFRLTDFRNYDHSAVLPVFPMGAQDIDNGGSAVTKLISMESIDGTTAISKNDIYHHTDANGDEVTLNRGILMINSRGDKVWCTDEIDWTNIPNKTYWKTGEITCYDFFTNASKTVSGAYNASADDIFLAVTSDRFDPNPYKWNLTGNEPAGSKQYVFIVTAILNSTGTSVSYKVTMSSIGDLYSGGSASNIAIQLHDSLDTTSAAINTVKLADTKTIGREDSFSWEGAMSVPSAYQNKTLYIFVYANNKLQTKTGIMMDIGDLE